MPLKQGRVLVLRQRLAIAVDYLDTHAVADAVDQLNYASIYESVGARGVRTDGWHKRRWRVEPLPIEGGGAVTRFEEAREGYESVVVLGQTERYETECLSLKMNRSAIIF